MIHLLAAVSILIFSSQLEKAGDAADPCTAYAEVSAKVPEGEVDVAGDTVKIQGRQQALPELMISQAFQQRQSRTSRIL